jgi:hypothetical protein
LQSRRAMKHRSRLVFVLLLLARLVAPAVASGQAEGDQPAANVNSRYPVESVALEGVRPSAVSRSLRADIRRLVGANYDQDAVNDLAFRLRDELRGYTIDVRVGRGTEPAHLTVTFVAERRLNRRFDVRVPLIVYNSQAGWSGVLAPSFETHHNVVSFGLVSSVDEHLERDRGYRLRYEHRQVGTGMVQIGVSYEYYHPSFWTATETGLAAFPEIPGIYRTRQNFAPSVSVLPLPAVKLTFGTSFQNLGFDGPAPYTRHAYAVTFDAQVRQVVRSASGVGQAFGADYGLRAATRTLESDFVYTRHVVSGDYTLTKDRHGFGAHVDGGYINGPAPLFERFSLGNSRMLRGWDRFDVAPIGGSRLAYGSLEYRYRPFQVFYDVGTVWDAGRPATVRHSLGAGLAWRNGAFVWVAFPVRLEHVSPVLIFGIGF